MLIRDIPGSVLARRLRSEGVHLDTGAFTTHVRIGVPQLADQFSRMYAAYPIDDPPGIDDARVSVRSSSAWRKHIAPEAVAVAGTLTFGPVPAHLAYTILETALNWAVASTAVAPMLIHSAVLERGGRALLMPAPSGSGKSTLCAAMSWRGWRLLSDEMAPFSFEDGCVYPNPRPVSLKNQAVDVIRAFDSRARFSPLFRGTPKGDIAYMHAPSDAIDRAKQPALPGLIVIPTFRAGEATKIESLERATAFRWLVDNSVNYSSMLRAGYDLLTATIERCRLYVLSYSNLDEAILAIDRLHEQMLSGVAT